MEKRNLLHRLRKLKITPLDKMEGEIDNLLFDVACERVEE